MTKYGKYADDNSVEVEATECILTGRELTAPYDTTVRYRVPGTQLFYRILGSQHYRMTDEMQKQWTKEAPTTKQEAPAFVSKSKSNVSVEVKND